MHDEISNFVNITSKLCLSFFLPFFCFVFVKWTKCFALYGPTFKTKKVKCMHVIVSSVYPKFCVTSADKSCRTRPFQSQLQCTNGGEQMMRGKRKVPTSPTVTVAQRSTPCMTTSISSRCHQGLLYLVGAACAQWKIGGSFVKGVYNINCHHQKRCFSLKCTTNRLAAGLRSDSLTDRLYSWIFKGVWPPRVEAKGRSQGRMERKKIERKERNLGKRVKERR